MPRKSFVILCLLLPASMWAQHLSIGVTGGLGLTDAFIDQTTPDTGHTYSAQTRYSERQYEPGYGFFSQFDLAANDR